MPQQTIGEIAADLREECATYMGARRNWDRGLDGRMFWISPRMRCWQFREASASLYEFVGRPAYMKKQEEKPKGEDEVGWTFVDIKLSDEELEMALSAWPDEGELWDVCCQTMIEGYKFSLMFAGESSSYCASLTGRDCVPENRKKTITGWYDTASEAMRVVLYKHHVIAAGLWSRVQVAGKRRG